MEKAKAAFTTSKRRRRFVGWSGGIFVLLLIYWFSLPRTLFQAPLSTVLEDRDGALLGARIASDGQWRFPGVDTVPDKFAKAIVTFEDKRFWSHPGFDWRAFLRAMRQNIRAGRIVSGGSTLTMQVMRLARGNPPRTVFQKAIEVLLATRLELRYDKENILAFYAANAPFGGNIVGLEAASWRYFGKSPSLLSWGEAATLAVLPNSPALIHPGRNRPRLLAKRNRLLDRLYEYGHLDSLGRMLARSEPLPDRPFELPRLAPHLLDRVWLDDKPGGSARVRSTLDGELQRQASMVVQRHHELLRRNEIHNLAALILHIPTGEVRAYIGNAPEAGRAHGEAVDIIRAPRSTGSILKPLLYALMLQDGQLSPRRLIPDIPTVIAGFQPRNYHEQYDGAVTVEQALVRSLNVPLVLMLRDYGVDKFHYELRKMGFGFIDQPPDHYGLSLILGGAEASLWQITNVYAAMSRTLTHYPLLDGRYHAEDFQPAHYELAGMASDRRQARREAPFLDAGPIWLTFQAMQQLERPGSQGQWRVFRSERPIAWKTGTSYGFRDAWAVGVDAEYAVGVWAGNADGEGRPGLVGVEAAAPVLFDLFDLLPAGGWFEPPYDDLMPIDICARSGYRPLRICPADTIWMPRTALNLAACPYHQQVQVDATERWRLHAQCADIAEIRKRSWFTLPPAMEYYFARKDPNYRPLPPFRPDCVEQSSAQGAQNMEVIYPGAGAEIYLPVDLNGELSSAVFQVAHRLPNTIVYWHLDEYYLGHTRDFHELALKPAPGAHTLTLVDQYGQRLEYPFKILARE